MKYYLTILALFILACGSVHAQGGIQKRLDSLVQVQIDSLKGTKLDTLIRVVQRPDSLYLSELDKLDSALTRTQTSIDSLTRLQLPTVRYTRQMDSLKTVFNQKISIRKYTDSLNQKLQGSLQKGASIRDSVQRAIDGKILKLQDNIAKKLSFTDSLRAVYGLKVPGLKLPSSTLPDPLKNISIPASPDLKGAQLNVNLKQPDLNVPDLNISKPDLPIQDVTDKVNKISDATASVQQFPEQTLGNIDALAELKQKAAIVKEVSETADGYKADLQEIREGNLERVETIPKELEKIALEREDIQVLQQGKQQFDKQQNMLEQYKTMVTQLDSGNVADKIKDIAKENMPDYFANEQDKLKAGIAQLDKLKSKYGSFADSRYLPRRVPNPMRQLSFRERIIPALSLQFFKATGTSADITTSISYKLSGRFRPGVSAFWRLSASVHEPYMEYKEVHGYRLFNDLRIWSEFFLRSEADWIKFTEDAVKQYKFQGDLNKNLTWFRFNMGLHRTYPISKRFSGHAQLLYNVLDMKKFPQSRNSVVRIGFEYKFKKPVAKTD